MKIGAIFPTFSGWIMSINYYFWVWVGLPMRFDSLQMLRELAAMLRSGVPLDRAAELVGEGRGRSVRNGMRAVSERVAAGEPFSEALSSLPRRWVPDVVRSSVAAGERSGRLPEMLDEIAVEYERLVLIDRRIRSVLVYPMWVMVLAVIVTYILMWKVMPVFATFYEGMGVDPPLLARLVRATWIYAGPFLMIAVPVGFFFLMRSIKFRNQFKGTSGLFKGLAWNLPGVRGLRSALIEVRFARSLRVLVKAGVPLPEALDLCEEIVADDHAGQAIVEACRRIRGGERPSEALRGLTFLSPAFLWFLTDTEKRGDFVEVTSAMADAAEARFLTRVEVIQSLLEPAITTALGVIVGIVVIAMYQLFFQVTTVSGNLTAP